MANGDSIGIKTPWFGISAGGPNSIVIILILAIMALSGLVFYENIERQREHEEMMRQSALIRNEIMQRVNDTFYQLQCTQRLSIYIYTGPKGAAIDWNHMPSDLHYCVPKFLYER